MYYPPDYLAATPKERRKVSKGCGAGKGLPEQIVPDQLFGVCILEACSVHDWMYRHGKTQADKEFADLVFWRNMRFLIEEDGGSKPLRWWRFRAADLYYFAVKTFGDAAFWKNKKQIALQLPT